MAFLSPNFIFHCQVFILNEKKFTLNSVNPITIGLFGPLDPPPIVLVRDAINIILVRGTRLGKAGKEFHMSGDIKRLVKILPRLTLE